MTGELLWQGWIEGKQTYAQLAVKYGCSVHTVQRKIDAYQISQTKKSARDIILLVDTTYWGRGFGVMLFKDALAGENILKHYVTLRINSIILVIFVL